MEVVKFLSEVLLFFAFIFVYHFIGLSIGLMYATYAEKQPDVATNIDRFYVLRKIVLFGAPLLYLEYMRTFRDMYEDLDKQRGK